MRACLLLVSILPLLAGCQYDFEVRAERRGDAYMLVAPYTAGRFAPHTCIARLAVLEGEAVIWEIRNDAVGGAYEGRQCLRSDFPLVYGVAPAGYETVTPARPLRPGGAYRITGRGVSPYHGRFTIRADLNVDNQGR